MASDGVETDKAIASPTAFGGDTQLTGTSVAGILFLLIFQVSIYLKLT
ncbi:hypothetical protein H6F74_14165 [Trichocoleus sp. FACHB-90]|nr:hypothetical protein [Trichocoleus sp. FACHB-90]MBD1927379.1 hypothetical protein [Trichocoleus sp. FACHB-90]